MWANRVIDTRGLRGRRYLIALASMLFSACGGSDKADSDSSGGRAGVGNGGGSSAGVGNGGLGGIGAGPGSALVGRFWGHLPDNGAALVLEVPDAGTESSVRARIWKNGERKDTTLIGSAFNWIFSGERIADCTALVLDPSREQLQLKCGRNGDVPLVLRRSHATRILEAPVKAAALGFDPGRARFAFANSGHFWLWDTTAKRLHDLGAGSTLSADLAWRGPVSVAFAPDGRSVTYLRGGTLGPCRVSSLISFELASGESTELAKDAPCSPGFAQFSPDGKELVYFANDAGDGSGADLMHWSLADGKSAVIASKLKTATQAPYVLFGSSGQRLIFGTSSFLAGPQPLSSYDFATHEVSVLSSAARDIAASVDGAFVAFNEANGQVNLWDDGAKEMRVPFRKPDVAPDMSYRSGMSVSPNGRSFAFVTGYGDALVYDAAASPNPGVSALGTSGLYCYPEPTQPVPTMRAAYFTGDGAGILYFPKAGRQSDCSGGSPSSAFRFRDLASKREIGGVALDRFYRFGPHGEVVNLAGTRVTLWSPSRGAAPILDVPARSDPWLGFEATFARDADELVVELRDNTPRNELWAWSAASMSATQIAPAVALSGFSYLVEPGSGQVLFVDESAKLHLWSPGGAAVGVLDQVDAEVLSDTRRSIAVHGTRGDERGIFALSFGGKEPQLVEDGAILAISDSHVYYQAPDGVCVLAY